MGRSEGLIMQLEIATWYTGCSGKEQAMKVLEEAAEVFSAWEKTCLPIVQFGGGSPFDGALADEIADVITAACNLARMYGLDMHSAMERCAERNRDRGRL